MRGMLAVAIPDNVLQAKSTIGYLSNSWTFCSSLITPSNMQCKVGLSFQTFKMFAIKFIIEASPKVSHPPYKNLIPSYSIIIIIIIMTRSDQP